MIRLLRSIAVLALLARLAPGQTVGFYCSGDGTWRQCPCGNNGALTHGCANSDHPNGALLQSSGSPSLGADTFTLIASEHHASSLAIFMQGMDPNMSWYSGDGIRCMGSPIKRLFRIAPATASVVTAPSASSDPPSPITISARSAALGDPLIPGTVRLYQLVYRDAVTFCTPSSFNITNALQVTWGP